MKKKDMLIILTREEAAEALRKHRSQITRLPETVPKEYREPLIWKCRQKITKLQKTLKKLTDST